MGLSNEYKRRIMAFALASWLPISASVLSGCSNQNTKNVNSNNVASVMNDSSKNIFSTGKKEDIQDQYFVLKVKEGLLETTKEKIYNSSKYDGETWVQANEKLNPDNIPDYLILKGTMDEVVKEIPEGSIQYEFTGITDKNKFDTTDVSMICNSDGSYVIYVYYSYSGFSGTIVTNNNCIVPISKLSFEELSVLFEQHQDILDIPEEFRPAVSQDSTVGKSR